MAKSFTQSKSLKTKQTKSKTRTRIAAKESKVPPRSANKLQNQVLSPPRTPRPSPPMVKPLTLNPFSPPLVFSNNPNPVLILIWQRLPSAAPLTTITSSTTFLTIASTVSRPTARSGRHFSFQRKSSCPMAPTLPSPCL